MNDQFFKRPFPALTPAQRYSLDMNGYVIVPNTLTADEVGRTFEALQRLKRELLKLPPERRSARGGGAFFAVEQPHHHYLGAIVDADPAITDYVCHPRLVGMAE